MGGELRESRFFFLMCVFVCTLYTSENCLCLSDTSRSATTACFLDWVFGLCVCMCVFEWESKSEEICVLQCICIAKAKGEMECVY